MMKFDKSTKSFPVLGLLPNAPILNICDHLSVQYDPTTNEHFIELPENSEEIKAFANSIEVIDGQHRILAFAEDIADPSFSTDTPYEMIFSVFDRLGKDEKKQLFMITNDKQSKVDPNLLRLFKKQLNLLDEDAKVFDLVDRLNSEDYSPLKGRIIVGSTTISKGYKENQLSKILNKSDVYNTLAKNTSDNESKMCKGLSLYLNAWESVYGVSFRKPGKETLTKISGLRYVLYLLPDILGILKDQNIPASKEEFEKIILLLPKATDIQNVFTNAATTLAFRGEGATVKLAKDHGKKLVKYTKDMNTSSNLTDAW